MLIDANKCRLLRDLVKRCEIESDVFLEVSVSTNYNIVLHEHLNDTFLPKPFYFADYV